MTRGIKIIYCSVCEKDVRYLRKRGDYVYPYRKDLHEKKFAVCPDCKNFCGCHNQGGWYPLGCIASKSVKQARMKIHNDLLDPLWLSGKFNRNSLYSFISKELGYEYHTANIKTIEEARRVYQILLKIDNEWKSFTKIIGGSYVKGYLPSYKYNE